MIELVFVVVVLGILASVAIPRLATTRTDAIIIKGRSDVSVIRSAIVSERQSQLIKGINSWISKLSESDTTTLFLGDGDRSLLLYGISSGNSSGEWSGVDPNYVFKIGDKSCNFSYDSSSGIFSNLSKLDLDCKKLTW